MEFRLVCIIIALLAGSTCSVENTLRFVTVVWRHGDRAPSGRTLPTDTENGPETWPQGFGELTTLGMKQHQALGQYFRKRYIEEAEFLSENYSASEVYIYSSAYNRTIMSALSNMLGMYPLPADQSIFGNGSIWQPIPIHSRPREDETLLWTDHPCPVADHVYRDEVMQSKEVKQVEEENKQFLQFLKEKSGLERVGLHETWAVWDPLNCERIHNEKHKWPAWVTDEIFENVTQLMHFSTNFFFHHPTLKRLRGSNLFKDIAVRMDQKANKPNETRPAGLKYYVYSAHDTTIIALLEALGAFDGKNPEYATAVMFELHEKVPGEFTVETWHMNETWAAASPVRLSVEGCDQANGQECKLSKFVEIATSLAPQDWYAECGLKVAETSAGVSTATTAVAIVLGILAGIFLLAFTVVLVTCLKLRGLLKMAKQANDVHNEFQKNTKGFQKPLSVIQG